MTANPLPPLTPEEYEALKADIALRGVIVPILLDVHGNVIDGHHRRQAARELGEHIICPEETLECTEEEARDLAVVLNTHRRQLSRDQRREAVAQLVKLGPGRSNRQIARDAGVDHQTVAAVRGSLEATGEVPQLDRTVGADGRERPARRAEPVPEPEVIGGQRLAPLMSSQTDDWATPQPLFDTLNAEFAFGLDVCATASNAKCAAFYDPSVDGLAQPWTGACWMNPPYGEEIARWVEKAAVSAKAGATVVALVPARTDTAWWWSHCRHHEVRFLRGRLRFGGAQAGAPFPSAVVVFGRPARVVWWEHREEAVRDAA